MADRVRLQKFNETSQEWEDITNSNPLPTIEGLSLPVHDHIGVAYPDTITEIYTYKVGGASGETVATVTIIYTDSTKKSVVSITKV